MGVFLFLRDDMFSRNWHRALDGWPLQIELTF